MGRRQERREKSTSKLGIKAMQIENWKMKTKNWSERKRVTKRDGSCGEGSDAVTVAGCLPRNLHFSLCTFQFSLLFFLLSAVCLLPSAVSAQTVPDKMVATVTNGSRATPDLITYSDLVWQLTLEPGTPVPDHPSSAELNHALRLLEDQLLILQEARKLPSADTQEGIAARDKEVSTRRDELAHDFGGQQALQERMARVGLTTDQLDLILRDRVMVDQYLDFRFRAFTIVTQKEVQERYDQTYGRLKNSGRIVPTLEEVRSRIEQELTNQKIEADIDRFVDDLRDQPGTEIVVLNPV